MNTNLPPAAEVKAHNTMTMRQLKLSQLYEQVLTLNINIIQDDVSKPMRANVYKVNKEEYKGYLPSKVWYLNGDIHFLFYTSDSILTEQKPFGNKDTYIATLLVDDYTVVEYESGTRIFIDQVNDGEDTVYVFMFDQDTFDDLVVKDERTQVDEPVEVDLIELVNKTLLGQ